MVLHPKFIHILYLTGLRTILFDIKYDSSLDSVEKSESSDQLSSSPQFLSSSYQPKTVVNVKTQGTMPNEVVI